MSAQKASFLVAGSIAKVKKRFNIGEEFILPATKDICRELFGEHEVKKVANVPIAAAMTGRLPGLTTRIKENAFYTVLLVIRKLSPEINNILQDVIKVINYIKVHALNSRLFDQLCEEMDAEHKKCLLLYTEVKWLARGKLLTSFWVTRVLPRLRRRLHIPNAIRVSRDRLVAKKEAKGSKRLCIMLSWYHSAKFCNCLV